MQVKVELQGLVDLSCELMGGVFVSSWEKVLFEIHEHVR